MNLEAYDQRFSSDLPQSCSETLIHSSRAFVFYEKFGRSSLLDVDHRRSFSGPSLRMEHTSGWSGF